MLFSFRQLQMSGQISLAKMLAIRLVVVVLPCVPAIAIPWRKRISSASIIARGTMGMLRARAAIISGLSG